MATAGSNLYLAATGGYNHFNLGVARDGDGSITTKTLAELATYNESPYFALDDTGVWTNFGIRLDAVTTEGSDYPRSELRELDPDGTTLYGFNPTTGDHWMSGVSIIDTLARYKKAMVIAQMHDTVSDSIMIASQNIDSAPYPLDGLVKIVIRINGTGVGIPVPIPLYTLGTPIPWKIRVGATFGWQVYIGDMSTPFATAATTGIALTASGLCYFKAGCYSNTNATVESDGGGSPSTFYVKCRLRALQHWHTSWTTPVVQTSGSNFIPGTGRVSNVKWGTSVHARTTASGVTITPPLPVTPTEGDVMLCIIRASRGNNSSSTVWAVGTQFASAPSSPAIATQWQRVMSLKSPTLATNVTGAYPGGPYLANHNVRFMVWKAKYTAGMSAPDVTYAGTTLSDAVSAQIVSATGLKDTSDILDFLDQYPSDIVGAQIDSNSNENGINFAAATSTSVLGPSDPTPGTPVPGALAIAAMSHETNATTLGVGVVTGATDTLTWAEGGQHLVTTTSGSGSTIAEDEPAWANDWAIIPDSGYNQAIPVKSITGAAISNDSNKPNTSITNAGKGWGLVFTCKPEPVKSHGLIGSTAGSA
jgi:hypothetical protein